ncbi:MAG: CotH kinase family protein [Bacteroidales bacterium]|nr:CotH kinase family protein [Bacteroidales bacterium]
MKNILRTTFVSVFCAVATSGAAQEAQTGDSLFVYSKNGTADVFPAALLKGHVSSEGQLRITLNNDSVVYYAESELDSVRTAGPSLADLPTFTSFKFNNKYNPQVFTDVIAAIDGDHITASVGAIGKRLTPSFQLSEQGARVYVDGAEQTSKVSRPRFDGDVVYTIARDGWRIMSHRLVQDEVWSEPSTDTEEATAIPLTVEMLSTNAPSNYEETEGLAMLLDDDPNTFFHSTWGTGQYEKLPTDQNPYLQVDLEEAVQQIRFGYETRSDAARYPMSFLVQASFDGTKWDDVRTFAQADGLPYGIRQSFTSQTINLGNPYRHLRFVMTSASYKNYLAMASFSLYEVTVIKGGDEPTLISPAVYEYAWRPYGRDVTVSVDWLTDKATSVPRIDLNIENGQMISSKDYYLNAEIIIDGAGVWPSMTDSVQVKGRGNSSWSSNPYAKNPYRLKFASKKKPFGMTAGKSWVLLANKLTGSMMTNAVAQRIAKAVASAGANDIVPVELYINGEYRGSYNFTQHVGFANNSVSLDDETNATLLELDQYFDETYKFRDSYFQLPVNIKEPDLSTYTDYAQQQLIENDFNAFTQKIYSGGTEYEDDMDCEMFARYMLVNMLSQNLELLHPKSVYLYKEDLLSLHSKYIFGPAWDFDWGFGYEGTTSYCQRNAEQNFFTAYYDKGRPFFTNLFYNSDKVKRATYALWTKFLENDFDELLEYVDDYYAFANSSFVHNATKWGDGSKYDTFVSNCKTWLQQHADYIYRNLQTYDLTQEPAIEHGDVNLDGAISVADVVCVMNNILGIENETFDFNQADADENKEITVNDAVHIVALVMQQPANTQRKQLLPRSSATVRPQAFAARVGSVSRVPVTFSIDSETAYAAVQFDVLLPEGIALQDLSLPDSWQSRSCRIASLGEGRYRVAVYGAANEVLPAGEAVLDLYVTAEGFVPADRRVLSIDDATLVNVTGEELRLMPRSAAFDMDVTTGIDTINEVDATGGDALYLDAPAQGSVKVYTADGRLFRTVSLAGGKQRIALPSGLYIVNNKKILVK